MMAIKIIKSKKYKQISINMITKVFNISKSTYYYQSKTSDANKLIANKLLKLTKDNNR